MASTFVEASPEFNQLFRDISLLFSPAESKDVVQSAKRIYGKQFYSLGDQDLLSCLAHLHKFGYVSSTNLTLLKEFVAPKSDKKEDVGDAIENFKVSFLSQAKPEIELQGRSDEIKKITERLQIGQTAVVNLYGSAGVGKTTLAKEVCAKWPGKFYVFDLREAKDMVALYIQMMQTLEPTDRVSDVSLSYVVGRIHDQVEKKSKGQPVLFLLDNVEQFTGEQGENGEHLRTDFMEFLGKLLEYNDKEKTRTLNTLLTSRHPFHVPEKVVDFKLEPLDDSNSEEILLPMKTSYVNAQQKKKLLCICKGVPLFLKGIAAVLRQGRKSPDDVIVVIEKHTASEREAGFQMKSKLEEDAEKPSDLQEDEVDEVIKEMFDTLPSDSLKLCAVSISLFCGPFSASTAAKVLGVTPPEAAAQLEGLVTSAIIDVVKQEAKECMYDIHPLLRKYADSIKNDAKFRECYNEAKGRFREHFWSKMETIARLIESDFVKAFNKFAEDRKNYDFAIDHVDISLLPEYFSVPGEFRQNALITSIFHTMMPEEKQTELFHSWAEKCKDDGMSGSLFRAQLRCWEARQVLNADGTHKAFEVLQKASSSLGYVEDKSTEDFKLTRGLFFYVEGEINSTKRDYKKALESLKSSLDLMEEPLKPDTNLARCYNAMGNCYYGLNKVERALDFYNKALKMRLELSGSENHYDMPVYKNQIGTVYQSNGEFDKAVECYLDALRLLKKLEMSGYEHEAVFCRNLANVYNFQGKYSEAIEPAEKAYNIRMKRLGKHPETVRSIYQLGVIQANLHAFDKALECFRKAWEMEKSLEAGNRSEVWREIISGVFRMCQIKTENEEFRQDALAFCQRYWEKEKESPQFSFTAVNNKDIIDAILSLLGADKKKDRSRAARDLYEKEALWFYDGMQKATEEDFYNDFDQATESKVLNEMLTKRIEFLNNLIYFCRQHDKKKQLILKHKGIKLKLLKTVLERLDFIGEEGNEKATLKSEVEQLLKDKGLGEKESIIEFRENLLTIWQQHWEEGKGADESKKMLEARERMIKGILQLCKELKKKELRRRYKEEALSFYERLWEIKHSEMKTPEMEDFLNQIKRLASSIGDRERVKVYRDVFQTLRQKQQPGATLRPKEYELLQMEKRPFLKESRLSTSTNASEETEGREVESEEESEEETEVEEDSSVVTIFKGTVTSEGAHWDLKVGAVHLTFPPNAVSKPTPIVVHKWNCSACSPPLEEHEAIVSNVIEISTITRQAMQFNADVKLFLSHSAPDLQGYEVVIERQTDRDEWEDVNGTKDLMHLSDIEDDYPSPKDVPDFYFPVAQAGITKCSIYAVVCRLKSSSSYTITSTGGLFSHPDYPGVTITIPENAVAPSAKFPIKLKVQEVPREKFEGLDVFIGPIVRIICPEVVQFLKFVTIQLPVSLRDEQEGIPDPSTCCVRVFLKSDGEHKEWVEITGDLVDPATFDGTFVRFQVERFSKYACSVSRCNSKVNLNSKPGIISYLSNLILARRAVFFAYFLADSQEVLYLICCPLHLRGKVKQELKGKRTLPIEPSEENSTKNMIPKRDKAFVSLSGGISAVNREHMENFHLMLEKDEQYMKQLWVRLSSNQDLPQVEFHSTPEHTEKNLMSRLHLPILKIHSAELRPSTSFGTTQSPPAHFGEILKVVLLASEWGSSKGGLSTINRTLAIFLAKESKVEVTLLVPQFTCTDEDKRTAQNHSITIREAQRRPGFSDPLDWLSFPPRDLTIDIIIGHGAKLGKQANVIRDSNGCKWVQFVHTSPEQLAMFKNCLEPIAKGDEKNKEEIALCKLADLVVAVGPKLKEYYLSRLRSSQRDVFQLTPGTFADFADADVKHSAQDSSKFRVLAFGRADSEDFSLKGYDVAAGAVAELKDSSYCLIFVGAPDRKQDEVAKSLLETGISRSQLTVRSFEQNKEMLKELFCEADVAIMPSRTEGFGLTALEAMSAGLPILVSGNSGFGEALRGLPLGESFVIESQDPKEWAKAIAGIRHKSRAQRLQEIRTLRRSYEEKFSWEKQCKSLVDRMWKMVNVGRSLHVLQQMHRDTVKATNKTESDLSVELKKIADKGFTISNNQGKGDCMFYALSEQLLLVKGIQKSHKELRATIVQYLKTNPTLADGTKLFNFVHGYSSWDSYLTKMAADGTWGDHVILHGAANCFKTRIHVIRSLPHDLIISPGHDADSSSQLVLGHVHELHYVSLIPTKQETTV